MITTFDLRQVTLINENRIEAEPGDVSLFQSPETACAYLEPWWVLGGEGFALTASGDRVVLGLDAAGRRVVVIARERHPQGSELVEAWLGQLASSVQAARRDNGPASSSPDDIIRYVGLER